MKHSTISAMIAGVVILNFILSANNRGTTATIICPIDHASCYERLPTNVQRTWQEAKDACKDRAHPGESYLFVPSSDEEEALINEFFPKDVYIGCKAVTTNSERANQFECYAENENVQYHNWKENKEPEGKTDKGGFLKIGGVWDQTVEGKETLCELPKLKEVKSIPRTCRSGTYVAYPYNNKCMAMVDNAALQEIDSLKNVKRCGAACMKDLRCYSFNFIRNSEQDERGRCELFGTEQGFMIPEPNCQHYTLE